MDLKKLMFWKKKPSGRSSRTGGGRRQRQYGYGYGLLKDYIRVPQLGASDLFLITGLLLVSNAFMVISLFKFYLNMADYSHAVLVPVIAAAAGWKVLSESETKPRVVGDFWGFPILMAGLAIQFVAMWYEIGLVAGGVVSEYFTSVGLVISAWGLFICFFGVRALRMFWFPLLYLAFLVPGLPGPPEIWLKNTLRNIVTAFSAGVLEIFQYDVFVQNNTMEIVGHKMAGLGDRTILLGVADACSGIRSLWAMLAVAPAIAWFLRLRPFLIAMFLPLGVFLAMFQNVLRVVATAVLCDFFGMEWASGTRHDAVGGVSFFLSSIIMVVLARVLAPPPKPRSENYGAYSTYGVYGSYGASPGYGTGGGAQNAAYHAANDPEAKEEDEERETPVDASIQREYFFTRIARVRVGVYFLLALMFLGQLALFQRYAIRNEVQYELTRNRMSLDAFPGEIGPYTRISWGELPEQALRILRPTESYVARYVSPNSQQVYVIINFWKPVIGFNGSSWSFPHSPDVCFREAGWKIERKVEVPADLADEDEVVYSRLYANDQSRQMVMYWYNRDEVTKMMNDFIDVDLATTPEDVEERAGIESGYFDRLRHMVRSWSRPQDYSRFQYSIGIYVQQQGSVDETIHLAQDFSRELRRHIGAFGLMPLQKILETRALEKAGEDEASVPELSALEN